MTEVWAHRGASAYAPENTLEAFELAADMQADGVELDVQLTKDEKIVVIHDEVVDRVSSQKGRVKDFTLQEIRQINVNRTIPSCPKAVIPTLEEVYDLLKSTNLKINVEFKTGIYFYPGLEEKVLKLTREWKMEERIWYSSFNHYTVKRIKEMEPLAKTGMLYEDGIYKPWEYVSQIKADALHPALYNLQYERMIEECKKRNLKLHVWTVNEKEDMRRLMQEGIDAVITNYPDIAVKMRQIENSRK